MPSKEMQRTEEIGDVDISLNRIIKPTITMGYGTGLLDSQRKTKIKLCVYCQDPVQQEQLSGRYQHSNMGTNPGEYCFVRKKNSKEPFGYCGCVHPQASVEAKITKVKEQDEPKGK